MESRMIFKNTLTQTRGEAPQNKKRGISSVVAVLQTLWATRRLSDETLIELESVAPAAATFLMAKRWTEPVDMSEPPFDDKTRKIATRTADYISNRVKKGIVLDDRLPTALAQVAVGTGDGRASDVQSAWAHTPWTRI